MIPLADLLADPTRAHEVPPEAVPALMAQCAALQTALASRLLEENQAAHVPVGKENGEGDRWLTSEEAAQISSLGVRWLYRHWPTVPGAKKFSPRRLRFREAMFRRWLQKGA